MIKINIVTAISIYLCFSLSIVFILWIFYNYRKSGMFNKTDYLQQCPYCTFIFFNYKKTDIQICPQCKSYLTVSYQDC